MTDHCVAPHAGGAPADAPVPPAEVVPPHPPSRPPSRQASRPPSRAASVAHSVAHSVVANAPPVNNAHINGNNGSNGNHVVQSRPSSTVHFSPGTGGTLKYVVCSTQKGHSNLARSNPGNVEMIGTF